MGIQKCPINVRLTDAQAEEFERLSKAMPALPKANLIRLLLAASFQGGLQAQIERVTRQLVDPAARPKPLAKQIAPPAGRKRPQTPVPEEDQSI